MDETNNSNQPKNASSKYLFITSPSGGKAYFNKGFLNLGPLLIFIFVFIFTTFFLDGSSKNPIGLLIFKSCIFLITAYSIYQYAHVAHEVRLSKENISIRKFKVNKVAKWEHIKFIRAYSFSTNGFTLVWIKKKKDAPKLSTRYFNIFIFPPSAKYETDLLNKMFLRIKTYTELKYNKNI